MVSSHILKMFSQSDEESNSAGDDVRTCLVVYRQNKETFVETFLLFPFPSLFLFPFLPIPERLNGSYAPPRSG